MPKVRTNFKQNLTSYMVGGVDHMIVNNVILEYQDWMGTDARFVPIDEPSVPGTTVVDLGDHDRTVTWISIADEIDASVVANIIAAATEPLTPPPIVASAPTAVEVKVDSDYTIVSHGFGRYSVIDTGGEKVHEAKWLDKKKAQALLSELNN